MSSPTSVTDRAKAAGWAVMPLALMFLGVKIFWPDVTTGTILGGAISGLLTALVALGIAIVYRANRIVNFSAADLGQTPAILALLLYASQGWNIYLATATGLVAAVVLGVLVEFLFLRRFFRAPRLILTVATIGVTQVIVALGLLLPQWLGSGETAGYPSFINWTFTVGHGLDATLFSGDSVLVLIVVPLILLGLVAFFRFTSIGVALRASAEDADRASLLGIPVRRLQSVVWGLAALLAFVAMFMRIGTDGPTLGQVLDPALLLSALGAAVIGRMERLPTITLSAIGLGIVSQGARFHYSSDAYRSMVIAGIIAIALLVQRRTSLSRLASAATSTWQETREVRAIPAELRRERAVRIARLALGVLLVIGLVLIPIILPSNRVQLVTAIATYALIGVSLVVLTGWAGQVSLGQMAFVAWGAALAGELASRWHVDTGLIMLACGAMGSVLMVIVGMPTLRARGLAFAVITLAFALATSDYLLNTGYSPLKQWLPLDVINRTKLFGVISIDTDTRFYALTLAVLALALWAVRGLRASRTGRVIIGVRDNERASEAYAIHTRTALMLAFSISGFIAGVAGALFVLQQQLLVSQSFTPDVSLRIFAMVVVGGLGSISGAVLGAVFVYGVQYFLPSEYAFLATGAGLLLVLLLVPGGLGAMFGDARDGLLRMYARHKHIRVPSLLADTRVEPEMERGPMDTFGDSEVEALEALPQWTATVNATEARAKRTPPRVWFTIRGFPFHVPRTPNRFFHEMSGGQALFPLIVLAGMVCSYNLDQTVFGILAPDIKNAFDLSNQGYLTLVALTQLGGLLLAIPLAFYSDRLPRITIALVGAVIWGVFGFATGLCFTVLMLVLARSAVGIGRAVVTPTHNSLLADYYPPEVRPDVFGFHAIGLATGALIGPALGGLLAHFFGWRLPFFVFAIPTFVFVIIGLKLKEPGRGHWERAASGASEAVIATDEVPPSYSESIRILWQVGTLRRIWYSLPFLAASFLGLVTLTSLYYEQIFNLGDAQRGIVAAIAEPAQILAILLGIPLAARLMLRDPGLGLRMLAVVGTAIAGFWVVFALAPTLWIAVTMNILVSGLSSLLVPGIFAALSLAIPPKVRAMGFAMAALFIVPGLLALYVVGGIADAYGIRAGLLIVAPIFLIGAWILASGSLYVKSDINRVWTSTAAQAEVAFKRKQGEVKLLLVRNVDVHYDSVQVLFGVNFEVDAGEIVALLGTNGAGKSTLLKTISGLVEATNGAVVFDGRDMTYAPPNEVAARGVVQMPGGRGTFPALTVAEHLRLASWLHRKEKQHVAEATEHVLDMFPVLRSRLDEPAGNLSGGQQQMLALSMAFIEQPRLLMIDELSLGLAPTIVEQLLPLVRDFAARGTTVILVEQSVNLALTIAETAYFMEKGEIRFHGPTAELLERPDVLRSVFLEGADTLGTASDKAIGPTVPATPVRVETPAGNGHDPEDPPAIRLGLEGVSKRFGGLAALTGVSLSALGGEIIGIIGPNGAGKTTLFDTISGFTLPDSGTIVLGEGNDARDMTRLSPASRAHLGLGRSFQDGRLFPSLTVAETVAVSFERHLEVKDPIGAALHLPFISAAEADTNAKVEALLELLGITDFRDKLGRELSTGSRRIVDLACVLAHNPSVLLLDEPSSGIAQREAEALGPLLLRIREQTGATLLVIEHDVPLLLSVSDRLIALDLGEIVASGLPDDVVRDPIVVTSYLGTTEAAIARSGARGAS